MSIGMPIQFDCFHQMSESFESMQDKCYLKSRSQEFIPYWVSLQGNEIYFYKHQNDSIHKYMHSLTSCHLKNEQKDSLTDGVCPKTQRQLFAINISIPPDSIRAFYFEQVD